jgi:uncharacterized membrane protein (DUF441 family)
MKEQVPHWHIPLIFYSKKFWVSLAGLIVAILAAKGVLVDPDMKAKILELVTVIVGSYNAGQGIADGVSRGATSGVAINAGIVKKQQ